MLEYLLARTGVKSMSVETAQNSKGRSEMTNEMCKVVLGLTQRDAPMGVLIAQVQAEMSQPQELVMALAQWHRIEHLSGQKYAVAVATIAVLRFLKKPLPTMLKRLTTMERRQAQMYRRAEQRVTSDRCPACQGRGFLAQGGNCPKCDYGRIKPTKHEQKLLAQAMEVPTQQLDADAIHLDSNRCEAELHEQLNLADSLASRLYHNEICI